MSTPPSTYKHVMVDIETMGPAPHGAILSIGAVPFSIHQKECKVAPESMWFHERCTLKANDEDGRIIAPQTVEWWLAQSGEARAALLQEPRFQDVGTLCRAFSSWAHKQNGLRVEYLWAKPPTFDIAILRDAFDSNGVVWPFHYRAERDLRVLLSVGKDMGMALDFDTLKGTAHNAVEDAAHQARQACSVYSHMYAVHTMASKLIGERDALQATVKDQREEIRGWIERIREVRQKWTEGWMYHDLMQKIMGWPLPEDIEGSVNVEIDPTTFQGEL